MTGLGPVAWQPAPIRTERLVLRESEAQDRAAFIELFASPEVRAYLGGPRPRDELERAVPEVPGRRPGLFVVDLDGAMIGTIELNRRDAVRPGHVRPEAGEAELGYMFLPGARGCGYAAEACAVALGWFADVLPGEPVGQPASRVSPSGCRNVPRTMALAKSSAWAHAGARAAKCGRAAKLAAETVSPWRQRRSHSSSHASGASSRST